MSSEEFALTSLCVHALKSKLNATFDMKDLGEANHILGMHIVRNRDKKLLFLSQSGYIDKVLKRFNMEGGKALSTPLPSYVKLSLNDSPKLNEETAKMAKVPYSFAVWQSNVCNDMYKARYCFCGGSGH